jgi:hypothetical protein
MSENLMLQAALDLARRGLPVFPVYGVARQLDGRLWCDCGNPSCDDAGKHPIGKLCPKGLCNASKFDNVISHHWSVAPNANIAVVTGDVVALDVDPRHGGDETLARLEHQHGELPLTWRSLTGGGGEHVLFAAPPTPIRNSEGRLGHGLDVRGRGGYIVAPPSRHISGRSYAWSVDHHPADIPLAPLPNWIADIAAKPSSTSAVASENWQRLIAAGAVEGHRNTTIARVSGHLLRRYVEPRVTLELMLAWNSARCHPALPDGEVIKIVNSIAGKELKRREARDGRR